MENVQLKTIEQEAKAEVQDFLDKFVDVIDEENSLEADKKSAFLDKAIANFDTYRDRIASAMEILKEDPITETLLSRHKIHEDIFTKITDNGQQQYDIGFNDDEMMAFYECASRHYDEKNFSKAADVFLLLTTLHNTIQGFWYALGLSEEALEEYPSAVMAYMMAIEYDEDLSPLICCARCMAKMGNTHEAMTVLTLAIEEAQERGNATAFIKEATTFKNSL